MVGGFREHGTDRLHVTGALNLIRRQGHLRVGPTQIEDTQQSRRHGHRHYE